MGSDFFASCSRRSLISWTGICVEVQSTVAVFHGLRKLWAVAIASECKEFHLNLLKV